MKAVSLSLRTSFSYAAAVGERRVSLFSPQGTKMHVLIHFASTF